MLWRSSLFCGLGCKGERQLQSRDVSLRSAGKVTACRGMFSFDTKREPEKCQRFRRAGSTKKGLLAPFNPKEVGYTGKN